MSHAPQYCPWYQSHRQVSWTSIGKESRWRKFVDSGASFRCGVVQNYVHSCKSDSRYQHVMRVAPDLEKLSFRFDGTGNVLIKEGIDSFPIFGNVSFSIYLWFNQQFMERILVQKIGSQYVPSMEEFSQIMECIFRFPLSGNVCIVSFYRGK